LEAALSATSSPVFLIPAGHGWNVVRATAAKASGNNGSAAAPRWEVRAAATLEEAVTLLNGVDNLVLGLPVSAVLAQRLRLPTVDAADFNDMVRLQVEKTLPYPPEEVTTDFEVIEQTEEGSVVSAVAVHNQRLAEFAAPLLARGIIPRQVTVYAAQRAATHASAGRAFMIYPENEELVCAISEEGKIGFTHSLDGADSAELQRNLPQLALSAELQGINMSFPVVLLDDSLMDLRDAVQGLFVSRADLMSVEVPPAETKLNLLPDSWRQQRADLERQAQWKKRLLWAGGAYAAALLLFAGYVFFVRYQASRLDEKIARDEPTTAFVRNTEARWKALAPAIDPKFYPIEILLHIFESLPGADVQITAYTQSARQLQIDGEANTAALAYQFAEAVKKHPDLQHFQFDMAAPRILPNGHAQFRLEGKQK
jgi:type II secretory pathway component PulL